MADFGERLEKDFPPGLLQRLKDQTTREINDFSITLVFNDQLAGSGTLVDANGSLGILTAFHVVEPTLDADKDGILALIIALRPHRFEVPRECVEHIPIGRPIAGKLNDGPDLSFLKLSGESVLSTIKSTKSFYRLHGKSFDDYADLPLNKVPWWIAGSPASKARAMTSTAPEGALKATQLVAEASYVDLVSRDDFDVLTLDIAAGTSPFPDNYKGCSGGGVWISPLSLDHPNQDISEVQMEPSRLAGVAFFQGDLVGGRRKIFANGPESLKRVIPV